MPPPLSPPLSPPLPPSLPPSLHQRTAIVTGAGRGIGLAIAQTLAEAGAQVVLLGRDLPRLQQAAASLPLSQPLSEPTSQPTSDPSRAHLCLAVDIADESAVLRAFETIRAACPRVDILINNAGQAESAPLARTDSALWQRMMGVNLNGSFYCSRAVVGAMLKQDYARIINVASTAGLVGYAYVSAYCAAKHGVIGLTRSMALEAAGTSLTVNAVCPGYTETDMVSDAVRNIAAKTGRSEQDARASLSANNPQGRLITPQEVAQTVLWLCQPHAASITGQAISISGGEVMSR